MILKKGRENWRTKLRYYETKDILRLQKELVVLFLFLKAIKYLIAFQITF